MCVFWPCWPPKLPFFLLGLLHVLLFVRSADGVQVRNDVFLNHCPIFLEHKDDEGVHLEAYWRYGERKD